MNIPPPSPPPRQYYISRNGEAVGPYERSVLAELIIKGEVTDADMVWFEGAADWVPISSVRGEIVASSTRTPVPPPVPQQEMVTSPLHNLKQIIAKAMSSHSGYKKAFTGEKLSKNNIEVIANTFKTLNPRRETILFAALYKWIGKPTGIVITERSLYYRLSQGYMSLSKSGHIALHDINEVTAKHADYHSYYVCGYDIGSLGAGGPEITINGKMQGWIQIHLLLMSEKDEKLLIDLLNNINRSECLIQFRLNHLMCILWPEIARMDGLLHTPDKQRGSPFKVVDVNESSITIQTEGNSKIVIPKESFAACILYLLQNKHISKKTPCKIGANIGEPGPLDSITREYSNGTMVIPYILPILFEAGIVDINHERPNTTWICSVIRRFDTRYIHK